MTQTVTASSVGTAAVLALNPKSKATSICVCATSTNSSAAVTIEYTLDDRSEYNPVTQVWATVSSAITGTPLNTSGQYYSLLFPLAGLRINATTLAAGDGVMLQALQSVSGS